MPHSYAFLPPYALRDLHVSGDLHVDGAILSPSTRVASSNSEAGPLPSAPPLSWWRRVLALLRG